MLVHNPASKSPPHTLTNRITALLLGTGDISWELPCGWVTHCSTRVTVSCLNGAVPPCITLLEPLKVTVCVLIMSLHAFWVLAMDGSCFIDSHSLPWRRNVFRAEKEYTFALTIWSLRDYREFQVFVVTDGSSLPCFLGNFDGGVLPAERVSGDAYKMI